MKQINSAEAAYAASVTDVKELLKMVAENVKAHGRKDGEIHFGHVGDMNHIREKLMEILMFMNLPADMYEQDYLANLDTELKSKRKTK